MRKTALVLNSIVVVFFTCFLAYTLVARQHLNELARQFVTEKTLEYSQPIIEIAEGSIESSLVSKFLPKPQALAIRNEIEIYRKDPAAYVLDLTQQHSSPLSIKNAPPVIAKVAEIKQQIRVYYEDTLEALIQDLRIFSVSNLVAGLIAFGLAYHSSSAIGKPMVAFSIIMFVSVLYCAAVYVDSLSFFTILFRTHMGWWYAPLLSFVTGALYIHGHHEGFTADDEDASHSTNDADSLQLPSATPESGASEPTKSVSSNR